jgi:hypothetical protein
MVFALFGGALFGGTLFRGQTRCGLRVDRPLTLRERALLAGLSGRGGLGADLFTPPENSADPFSVAVVDRHVATRGRDDESARRVGVGRHQGTVDATVTGCSGLGLHRDLLADEPRKVRRRTERTFESGAGHFEGERLLDGIACFEKCVDQSGCSADAIEINATERAGSDLGEIDENTQDRTARSSL